MRGVDRHRTGLPSWEPHRSVGEVFNCRFLPFPPRGIFVQCFPFWFHILHQLYPFWLNTCSNMLKLDLHFDVLNAILHSLLQYSNPPSKSEETQAATKQRRRRRRLHYICFRALSISQFRERLRLQILLWRSWLVELALHDTTINWSSTDCQSHNFWRGSDPKRDKGVVASHSVSWIRQSSNMFPLF